MKKIAEKTSKNIKDVKRFQIAIYLRVSTDEQAENPEGSIKNQEQRIREFIKLKNMVEPFGEVAAVFSDPGVSAKDMNRPGFQKMLSAIQNGDVNMVLVTELSRFSRSTKDFAMLQEFLDEHDCKFLSIRENFDTSGAAGSMVMNLMASIAEFERRQTAERISVAFLARAKRGLYNGGSLPLGYRIDESKPGHLFIDESEAGIVKMAFAGFIKHGTLAATAKFLTSQNIRLPKKVHGSGAIRESQFTVDSLYRLLRNKAYIGVRVYQTKSGEQECPAVWKPIIDKNTFERVNRQLKKNCHHKRTQGENRYPYTLSGLIFCTQCGGSMSGKSAHGCNGQKVGYYEHIKTARLQSGSPVKLKTHNPHRIPSAKIEPVVWSEVKKFILSDRFSNELLEKARHVQESIKNMDEPAKLRQRIKMTSQQIEVLAERIASLPPEMDPSPLYTQMKKLQESKARLEVEEVDLSKASTEKDELVSFVSLEIFRKGLKKLIEKAEADKAAQASLIRKVVHQILIKPNGFELHFHVGKSYYQRELGNHPSSRIFSFQNKKSPKISKNLGAQNQISSFSKKRSSSLLTNGDRYPYNKPFIDRVLKGEIVSYERTSISGDRQAILNITFMPEFDFNKRVKGFIIVATDVSNYKEIELQLKKAKEEAEVANETKSAFLANMSHEIRTPLGAVIGFSELMLDDDMPASEKANTFEIIKRNGKLLSTIINDILDLSKVEAGKLEFEKTDVKLIELMNEISVFLNLEASGKGLQMTVTSEGVIPSTIKTDPTRLRQVLFNVVGNAIKFTEKGSINLKVKLATNDNSKIAFVVQDTGTGITAEQASRLFSPFTQADVTTTRKFGGTGLGLVLAKKFAKALGGDVVLSESQFGQGSTFTITIDHGQSREILFNSSLTKDTGIPHQSESISSIRSKDLSHLKILVVDDSPDNLSLIKRILNLSGASVDTANNGRQGIEKALQGNYHVILMDLQMPEMDGHEATRHLRSKNYIRPIIALTAHAMKEERKRCLDSGFNEHLTKPIDRIALIKTLAELPADLI